MAQYYQIVQNIDELKRLYPDLNVDNMQVVQVTGDDSNTQARSQVVYQTSNPTQQQPQQQQSTQYILQDDTVHHHQQQQQQQQQQQHTQQHVYHQVQQEQRHPMQHHQPHQTQQQIYYTSELHQNPTIVQHSAPQPQPHQHAQAQPAPQPTQQIVYRMPVPVQQQPQNTQQTQQILNNAHVIVQQTPQQVLIQTPQSIHQPEMIIRQPRILYSPNRTVMYTHQTNTQPQLQPQDQQPQQHLLQTQEVVTQQQQQPHTAVATHQQHVQMQQPRLVPHPRPIVSATQQPSQNVLFHQVQTNVGIQQPQGVMSSQIRSTIRTKLPRGGTIGPRVNGPRGVNTIAPGLPEPKTPKQRATGTPGQRGGRGRSVRGRGASTASSRSSSVQNNQVTPVNSPNTSITQTPKLINQPIQPQQLFNVQPCDFVETPPKYTASTSQTTVATTTPVMATSGTSTQNSLNVRYRIPLQKTVTVSPSTTNSSNESQAAGTNTNQPTNQPPGNYQSSGDLEDSIQAVVVKKTQEQTQATSSGAMATTLTTYYTENDNEDARIVKTQNGTCMTLSEYKKLNPQKLKVVPVRSQATTTTAVVAQKLQMSNAGQSSTTLARIAIQHKVSGTTETLMTSSSILRTSHNNYEIQTQHVIQNRSLHPHQNYSEKDRNSAKMLVILVSGEQRLITFTLPRQSCSVQDLLEQVGVPFDDKTTIQCVESPGAIIDFVVTVGFSVQESASELISKAEESLILSRQQENASAAAALGSSLGTVQRALPAIAPAPSTPTATATDDANKDQANKLADEIPRKIVQGYLAVCQYCGVCGYDHAKCERCKRVFAEEPKRIPCGKTAGSQPKTDDDKKRTISADLLNRAQGKALATLTVTTNRGGRAGLALRGRTRSSRTRLTEVEPVILTLSSDDEGDDEQSNKSANKVPVVNTAATAGKPFAFEPNVSEVDESRVYEDFRRENVADVDSAMDNLYTTITCKLIRIGTHRFESKDPVTFTKKGIRIFAPNCSNLTDMVALDIYKEEIVKIVAFFSKSFSIMFVYIMRKCSEFIRESLEMKPKNTALETPYFNSTERGDTYNKIILQIDTISEESINVIRSIYKSITLEEIQFHDANELLLRAAAKDKYVVNANSNEIRLDPNDIRQILIYPPGTGGISINTEDYMCLATDQYLNDVIIDFYLKWLHKSLIPEKDRERTYIFSSFFYKRLTTMSTRPRTQNAKDVKQTAAQKRHARVAKWTKDVNLFEKDFIIIPINELSHWFLAIICFPMLKGPVTFDTNEPIVPQPVTKKKKAAEKKISLQIGNTTITPLSKREDPVCVNEDDSERDEAEGDESDLQSDDSDFETPSANGSQRQPIKQPVILIFDSLAGASRSRVVATLRDYLTCEYQVKVQGASGHTYTKVNMPGNCVKVPQQNNFTDCGLYLLQYVEQFFTDPILDYTLPIKQLMNWFETIVVTRKREEISNLLSDLIRDHNPAQLPLPKIPFPTLNGELLERPDESFSEDQVEFEEEEMEEDGLEEDDPAETESSPEESSRTEKNNSVASTAALTTPTLPTIGRKIVLKRSFSGLSNITVNVRKTPKLDQ